MRLEFRARQSRAMRETRHFARLETPNCVLRNNHHPVAFSSFGALRTCPKVLGGGYYS